MKGGGFIGGVAYSARPMLHLELTDCDSLAFSYAKNIFGQKGMIISALLDLCLPVGERWAQRINSHHVWVDPVLLTLYIHTPLMTMCVTPLCTIQSALCGQRQAGQKGLHYRGPAFSFSIFACRMPIAWRRGSQHYFFPHFLWREPAALFLQSLQHQVKAQNAMQCAFGGSSIQC